MDRNIDELVDDAEETVSPSSRRAWIEIMEPGFVTDYGGVALLAEGVDRNLMKELREGYKAVALLAEGVDRNRVCCACCSRNGRVALLAEGVDRNNEDENTTTDLLKSPSSRRAWIEIT